MKEKYIEGINGSIRIKEKYIEIITYNKNKSNKRKHYVEFDEVKEVFYKKPTKDKYGYIKIELYTLDEITKEEIKYNIILDMIYERDIDEYKLVCDIIKKYVEINKKKKVQIFEQQKEKNPKQEEVKKEKPISIKKIKGVAPELDKNKKIKEEKKNDDIIPVVKVEKRKKGISKEIETKEISIIKKEQDKKGQKKNVKKEVEKDIVKPKEENTKETKSKGLNIETKILDSSLINKTSDLLFEKLTTAKFELKQLYYKYYVLSRYSNETTQIEEVERLIVEIEKLIKEIEKLKKEIETSSEKNIKANLKEIDLEENSNDLYKYLVMYKELAEEVEEVETKVEVLDKKVEDDKEKISLTNEQFEKDLNRLYGVESNKEFIEKYLSEIDEKLKSIYTITEKTIEKGERTKLVLGEISKNTKRMMGLAALSMAKPGIGQIAGTALMINAGTKAMRQMFNVNLVTERYTDYVTTERVVIPEAISFNGVTELLSKSKSDINDILNKSDDYKDNPKYNELKNELSNTIQMIEEEERKLARAKETLERYQNISESRHVIRVIDEQNINKKKPEENINTNHRRR